MKLILAQFGLTFIGAQEGTARWDDDRKLCFPYRDQIGKWTIGKGHLIKAGEDFSAGITLARVDEILTEDCGPCLVALERMVHRALTLHNIAALVSWLINVGFGWAYRDDCSVIRELNAGRYPEAAHWLEAYDMADGHHRPYLLARRRAEEALFLLPDDPSEAEKTRALGLADESNALKMQLCEAIAHQFELHDLVDVTTPQRSDDNSARETIPAPPDDVPTEPEPV